MTAIQRVHDPNGDACALSAAARPPAISYKFFCQPVARVREGKMIAFNGDMLPDLPLRKEKIAETFSLFVDWHGKGVELELLGMPDHNRCLYWPIKFMDKYGKEYEWLSLKGGGMPLKSLKGKISPDTVVDTGKGEVWGLERKPDALHDMEVSNQLMEKGMHTAVYVAVIELEEIMLRFSGRKGVAKAVVDRVLPRTIEYCGEQEDFVPVICIRGFRNPLRISDVDKKDIEDCAARQGMGSGEYFNWWAREFATNLAIMHNTGMTHENLISHNVTLAAEIVDLNTVIPRDASKAREDMRDAMRLVSSFADRGAYSVYERMLGKVIFVNTYLENRRKVRVADYAVLLGRCIDFQLAWGAGSVCGLALVAAYAALSGNLARAAIYSGGTAFVISLLAPQIPYKVSALLGSLRDSLCKFRLQSVLRA
jgi:hypothetical protein